MPARLLVPPRVVDDPGPFFHGTRADLRPGDLLVVNDSYNANPISMRAALAGLLVALAVVTRGWDLQVRRTDLPVLALTGAADAAANGTYAVASRSSLVSVAAVLASLYPVVTALLAYRVHGERLRRALYTAALPASFFWNPHLIALYRRLRAAGKVHKSALIACARKLLIFVNTVVARGTPWQEEQLVRATNPAPA